MSKNNNQDTKKDASTSSNPKKGSNGQNNVNLTKHKKKPEVKNDPEINVDLEIKDNNNKKESLESEDESHSQINIEIPTDAQDIWAVERFFLFSLVLTTMKIVISVLAKDFQSIRVIAVDAVLDLIVSGLGIYLIQLQQKVVSKLKDGTQELKVNPDGVVGITSIQGLIFFIGGLYVFIESIVTSTVRKPENIFSTEMIPTFSIIPGLVLCVVICAKYWMYSVHKHHTKHLDNIALKSIESNLLIDLIVNIVAWVILLSSLFSNWVWFYIDPIVAIAIGIWMIIEGNNNNNSENFFSESALKVIFYFKKYTLLFCFIPYLTLNLVESFISLFKTFFKLSLKSKKVKSCFLYP
jgi:Co/Zn/Cd efflux system component